MWSDKHAPTLSLPDLAKHLNKPYRDVKAAVEARWERKQVEAEKREIRAAARRYRRGPARVVEELGDAVPMYEMSRLRWLELYRASLIERAGKGGELLNDDHFMKWLLKKKEWLRIEIAKAQNKVGWTTERGDLNVSALPKDTPSLVIASHHGRKERGETPQLITTATR